ncbi:flagellar basal body L-ring protein FlgH [Ideonella sp.]|jgi:flagellar L-ring protein precursor FlgH|uniref:flagellar basal body L-ring protein FlgH n=1 Tax=Ideonella sp. TaxID=1929293 RepID=UPI0037BE568A
MSSLLLRAMALALPVLGLSACQTLYPVPNVEFPTATAPAMPASGPIAMAAYEPVPVSAPPPAAITGSIYASAAYRPMFEDYRARHVGDTLTVRIAEKVSATQSATSTVDKKASVDAGISALPGVKANSFANGLANATANGTNKFEGSGTTENTNDFSGTITAIVTGVLPNGHLLIAGEKQIGVNHNVDVLRFTGQVDPRAILPGNTVQSAQIANVRVEHRGRGQMSDAQGIGWLARFFLNLLPV